MEAVGLAVEFDNSVAVAALGDLTAQPLNDRMHHFIVDVAADGVSEKAVQCGAMFVVHGRGPVC